MGAEDRSEESQLLHGRVAPLFLAQRSERVCNSSAIWNNSKRNQHHQTPSPTCRKTKRLHCSLVLMNAARQTYPPIAHLGFIHFLLLGLFCTYRRQAELPRWCMSNSFPFPRGALGAGDEADQAGLSTRYSFPHPAHGGHNTHLHFGCTSRTTRFSSDGQGSEQSLRGWGPFHIFPPTGMTKPSHLCPSSSLA